MKINNFTKTYMPKSSQSFSRAPNPAIKMDSGEDEETFYKNTIQEAKTYLGIKNLALILHQSSFPIQTNDLYIGSHISEKAVEFNKFAKLHGFDSIQLGPPGLTRLSPYTSCINSKNYLYADLEQLSTPQYANILPKDTTTELLDTLDKSRLYENATDQTHFNRAFYVHDKLFSVAYSNLLEKVKNHNTQALKLYSEFEKYQEKEKDWLDNDALFAHFNKKFGMDEDFYDWPDMNKNLIKYKNDTNSPKHNDALKYIKNIESKHGRELELYKFKQFVLDKQEHDFIKNNPDKCAYITDVIIGSSMSDVYANQDAYLKDYRVGTPYGGEGRTIGNGTTWGQNQTWDIPVLNPKKLFIKNANGEIIGLGEAGKVLHNKFSKLLDTYQNIRIDHAIGLVDPWIYNKNNVEIRYGRYENGPNNVAEHIIYKNAHGANISKMGKPKAYDSNQKGWDYNTTQQINNDIAQMPEVDPDGDYAKIIDEILIPLFTEKGLNVNDIVWESLGCNTEKFDEVYKNPKRPLPDISSSYQYQLQYRPKEDWMMIGCHDHGPFSQICTDSFYKEKSSNGNIMNPSYLLGNLYPDLNNNDRQKLINDMDWDRRLRVKSKYEELLRFGQKIQFTFMDFFGLDKTYNAGGTQNPDNWKLRLKKSYKEDYYKALEWKPGDKGVYNIPVNMPEQLYRAVKSKIITEGDSLQKHKELLDNLEYCDKNILKQSENI